MNPYCFVLMPFGKKSDENGRVIDFDKVYKSIIHPAIKKAALEPIRADEEIIGGIIHKPMFERLMLCDYAVADLTTANPNVLYELGIRHGIRPHSTVLIFCNGTRLPFDVALLRAIPYEIDSFGQPVEPEKNQELLVEHLNTCRDPKADSPLYQLISDFPPPEISRLKTDRFRDLVEYSRNIKDKLSTARKQGFSAVKEIERKLSIRDADPAIVIDLYLSYRAVEAHQAMVDLYGKMHLLLAKSVLVREQLGFALNRLGNHEEAEKVIKEIIKDHGPSSETNGLLGRVYKDRWEKAVNEGQYAIARGYLSKAIETYLAGFEADWRDAYPGINAVTLMEMLDEVDPRQKEILSVVRYAVQRRLTTKSPDYWDYATLLELSVIENNRGSAEESLARALTEIREPWEPKSTARNIDLICRAKQKRGELVDWIKRIVEELKEVAS